MPAYRNCNLTAALEIPQQAAVLLTSDLCDCQAVEIGPTLQLLHEQHTQWRPEKRHTANTQYNDYSTTQCFIKHCHESVINWLTDALITRKRTKCNGISKTCIFQPLALEVHGTIHSSASRVSKCCRSSSVCNIGRSLWNIISAAMHFSINSVFECNFNQFLFWIKHQTSSYFSTFDFSPSILYTSGHKK